MRRLGDCGLGDGDAGALVHLEERRGGSGPGSGSSSDMAKELVIVADAEDTSERSKKPRADGAPDCVGEVTCTCRRFGIGGRPLARAERGGVMSSGDPNDVGVAAASFAAS